MAAEAAEKAARPKRKTQAVGPVRVTLPAKIAYDPSALKESIGSILERIGCPRCFSGADCLFQTERSFVLDPEMRLEPEPNPWRSSAAFDARHQVNVALPPSVKHDIDKVFLAIDKVIDILGAHPCISGFDTLFRDEIIVVNPELEAQQF